MSRTTQPYRAGGSRPPSLVLDRMRAGGSFGARPPKGTGSALAKGMMAAAKRGRAGSKRMIPRY